MNILYVSLKLKSETWRLFYVAKILQLKNKISFTAGLLVIKRDMKSTSTQSVKRCDFMFSCLEKTVLRLYRDLKHLKSNNDDNNDNNNNNSSSSSSSNNNNNNNVHVGIEKSKN